MKIFSNITAIIISCIAALSSCAPAFDLKEEISMAPPEILFLEGIVSDTDGNPIEHIKVTVEWDGNIPAPETKYTDSDGKFRIDVFQESESPVTLTLTLEDIDGEENGGLFDGMSDTITLFDNDSDNATAILVYHLNRATASESSPQS